ncbi:MAG: AraC family transcriptional regulator [Oscillibacter sp.]|nr:AraC family transcriptional regulator [Oscillibacter sp.]MBR1690477.1 AraC family transcriptional regulator [Oscillibacter sp.]
MKTTRRAALVLTAVFALAVLVSSAFIVVHADHDCVGEGCPVCQQMAACAQTLRTLSSAAAAAGTVFAALRALTAMRTCSAPERPFSTPVALKVKLSN